MAVSRQAVPQPTKPARRRTAGPGRPKGSANLSPEARASNREKLVKAKQVGNKLKSFRVWKANALQAIHELNFIVAEEPDLPPAYYRQFTCASTTATVTKSIGELKSFAEEQKRTFARLQKARKIDRKLRDQPLKAFDYEKVSDAARTRKTEAWERLLVDTRAFLERISRNDKSKLGAAARDMLHGPAQLQTNAPCGINIGVYLMHTIDGTLPHQSSVLVCNWHDARTLFNHAHRLHPRIPIFIIGDEDRNPLSPVSYHDSIVLACASAQTSINRNGHSRMASGSATFKAMVTAGKEGNNLIDLTGIGSMCSLFAHSIAWSLLQLPSRGNLTTSGRQKELKLNDAKSKELWFLTTQRGSISPPHVDEGGVWTFAGVAERGLKAWFLAFGVLEEWCDGYAHARSDVERKQRLAQLSWTVVFLGPGDSLVMPPNTIHAVVTLEDTQITGSMAVNLHDIDESIRSTLRGIKYNHLTNEEPAQELVGKLNTWLEICRHRDRFKVNDRTELARIVQDVDVDKTDLWTSRLDTAMEEWKEATRSGKDQVEPSRYDMVIKDEWLFSSS